MNRTLHPIPFLKQHKILTSIGIFVAVLTLFIFWLAYSYIPSVSLQIPAYFKQSNNHYLNTGAFTVHYIKQGQGSPIVLMPGGGTWIYEYRNLIPALAENHTVYALDMPGQGYTTANVKDPIYNLQTLDQTLVTFMSELNIKQPEIVGHSWGGGSAIYFAEHHPNDLSKLVLLDSTGASTTDPLLWESLKWPVVGELTSKIVTSSLVRWTLTSSVYQQSKITSDMVTETYVPNTFLQNRKALYELERNLDWSQTKAKLSNIEVPTLLLWGKQDKVVDYSSTAYLHQHIKNSTLDTITNAGHSVQEDQPGEVDSLVAEFLGS